MLSEIDVTNLLHRIHSNSFFSKKVQNWGLPLIQEVSHKQWEHSKIGGYVVRSCVALQSLNFAKVFNVLKMQLIFDSRLLCFDQRLGYFSSQTRHIVARYWIFWEYTIYHKWLFYQAPKGSLRASRFWYFGGQIFSIFIQLAWIRRHFCLFLKRT